MPGKAYFRGLVLENRVERKVKIPSQVKKGFDATLWLAMGSNGSKVGASHSTGKGQRQGVSVRGPALLG